MAFWEYIYKIYFKVKLYLDIHLPWDVFFAFLECRTNIRILEMQINGY